MVVDVVTGLRGGLGNQLFQFAATLRVLRDIGGSTYELLLVEPWYRPNLSDFLDVTVRCVTRRDRARWSELAEDPGPLRPLFRRTSRWHERHRGWTMVQTAEPFEAPRSIPSHPPVKLEGHFQHPAWFEDDWRAVVEQLAASAPPGYSELVDERHTVVNLRHRGDYSGLGWALPPEHYRNVFARLERLGGERELVVIADEPAFVPWFAEFATANGFSVLKHDDLVGNKALNDFWTLAAGQTLAIPNSTFSWWAAAVATARNPAVEVMYPVPWLTNSWSSLPVPDLGLAGWTPLPSGLAEFG